MKQMSFMFLAATCLMVGSSFLNAQTQQSNAWLDHWIKGIELGKDQDNDYKAIESYNKAIQAVNPKETAVLINLVNERANLYLKMQDFQKAIKDFSFVLNQSGLTQEQKIEALWGRSRAYFSTGRMQEFEKDNIQLEQLQTFLTPVQETKDYIILKVSPYVLRNLRSEDRFIRFLINRNEVRSAKDVTFTPTGLVIIKKTKTK